MFFPNKTNININTYLEDLKPTPQNTLLWGCLTFQDTAIIYVFEGMGHYRSCALTLYPQIQFIISIALPYRKSITGGILYGACTITEHDYRAEACKTFAVLFMSSSLGSAAFLSTCDLEPFCKIYTKAALFHTWPVSYYPCR